MKKILLMLLFLFEMSQAKSMTFEEFMTSFKKEFGGNVNKGKTYLENQYEKNKKNDPDHAIVDTAQDAVVDSAKAYWGLTKEAYSDAKMMYYKYKLKELEKEKELEEK